MMWENTAAVELAAASLGVSTDRVPDRNTFRAGIEFFRFRHGPGRVPAHRRLMVFEKGRPCKVGHLAASRQIPVPPGHRRSMDLRRGNIDLAAHDTMRVLTTELRRLLAENRNPVLRLSGPTTLGSAQIARTLLWF